MANKIVLSIMSRLKKQHKFWQKYHLIINHLKQYKLWQLGQHFWHKASPRTLISIGAGIVLLFGLFWGLSKPTVKIPTVLVAKGSVIEQAEAVGYIKTKQFSTIKSQVDGIVEEIYHDEGEYVTKNTPLAKIKPMPTPELHAQAHQELANAIANEKEAELIIGRHQHMLSNNMIKNNDVNYTAARNKYALAKNSKLLAQQKLALMEHGKTVVGGKQIENVVVAPVDGHVLYRGVSIGDPVISISANQAATALFAIANIQELMFQGLVDERDAAKIKAGMLAKIKVGSLPEQEITGKISRVALQSDKENTKDTVSNNKEQNSPFNVGFKIEITELKYPRDIVLRSGYSATASIEIKKVNDVLLLPLRVIQFKDTKPHILLLKKRQKKPKQQAVKLGVSDNINVEIINGAKLGDKIVDKPDENVTTQD